MGILDSLNLFRGFFPPPLDILLSINALLMVVVTGYAIMDKLKKLNSIRTLIIYKDFTQEIKNIVPKDGKLKIKDGWEPKFDIQAIIPAKKKVMGYIKLIGFKQKNIVIAIEDLPDVISLRGIEGKTIADKVKKLPKNIQSTILAQWTKEEFTKWLKKVMAKSQADRKLFTDQQFYIFVGLLFGNMILLIMMAQRMGIF